MTIPKRIFYVWGYKEKKSNLANVCIENWRHFVPDYEIIEINEKSTEYFNFQEELNNNLWFKTVYDLKLWAYVADYIRVKTLYENGGIYLDTDITLYKSLDDLLEKPMFIGNTFNNLVEPAIFGAQKNNPILKDILNFYNEDIWKSNLYIITNIFDNILKNNYNIELNKNKIIRHDFITIFSKDYFAPKSFYEDFNKNIITNNTYSIHWNNASWITKKNLFFLTNKNKIPLNTLLKQVKFIEEKDPNANKKVKMPSLISIIIPVKNGENYLKEAINSIKKQNVLYEIIVVNDGSTDNTSSIARDLGCKVIDLPKSVGQVKAKNIGLEEANGEYIMFLDHDDILTDNSLQTMIKEFDNNDNLQVVNSKLQDFISPELLQEEKNKLKINKDSYFGLLPGSCLIRRDVFDIFKFDDSLQSGDGFLFQENLKKYDINVLKLDFISANRRIHNNNYGRQNKNQEFKDYASILRNKIKGKQNG